MAHIRIRYAECKKNIKISQEQGKVKRLRQDEAAAAELELDVTPMNTDD